MPFSQALFPGLGGLVPGRVEALGGATQGCGLTQGRQQQGGRRGGSEGPFSGLTHLADGCVDEREQPASRKADDSEKFSALAFKLMTDPFVGQLTFIRVYSGVLNSGATVYNSVKGKKERIDRILQMHANNREEIKEVLAGDIAACVGLKDVTTGETLCDPDSPIILERMVFPEPVIHVAVEPKTKADLRCCFDSSKA